MIPLRHMARDARGAQQVIRNMVSRCDSPTYGMSEADEWKWKYRNDELFRQSEIQRLKAAKLKRIEGKRHCKMSAKQVRAIYAERSSCLYCGCALVIGAKVLDHMDPLSKGGAHDASNLVVACKKCNTRKAAKEFVDWLPLVAEDRRKLVADWYARKHGARPEQIGLQLMMAA
jgi:5-methylcytosine-specific restriction endonuclease McrA